MDERLGIKRIDRIGATAAVPSTGTLEEVKSQRWIADRFFRLMGRSCFFWDNIFDSESEELIWLTQEIRSVSRITCPHIDGEES